MLHNGTAAKCHCPCGGQTMPAMAPAIIRSYSLHPLFCEAGAVERKRWLATIIHVPITSF